MHEVLVVHEWGFQLRWIYKNEWCMCERFSFDEFPARSVAYCGVWCVDSHTRRGHVTSHVWLELLSFSENEWLI